MSLMMTRRRRAAKNKGFNLIEAAIVLGIVGLVVGGIWVAATSVYANLRSKRATDELLQIVQGTRALFATSSVIGQANGFNLTASLAQSNVLPGDTLGSTPALATSANTVNPWGGNIGVFDAPNSNGTADTGFQVQFTRVPNAACVDLISRSTGAGRDSGMYAVAVINPAAAAAFVAAPANNLINNVALPITNIAALCGTAAGSGNVNVSFYFNLRG